MWSGIRLCVLFVVRSELPLRCARDAAAMSGREKERESHTRELTIKGTSMQARSIAIYVSVECNRNAVLHFTMRSVSRSVVGAIARACAFWWDDALFCKEHTISSIYKLRCNFCCKWLKRHLLLWYAFYFHSFIHSFIRCAYHTLRFRKKKGEKSMLRLNSTPRYV